MSYEGYFKNKNFQGILSDLVINCIQCSKSSLENTAVLSKIDLFIGMNIDNKDYSKELRQLKQGCENCYKYNKSNEFILRNSRYCY